MFPHKLHNLLVIIPYPALMLGIIVARGLKIQNVKLKLSFSPFLLLPFYLRTVPTNSEVFLPGR